MQLGDQRQWSEFMRQLREAQKSPPDSRVGDQHRVDNSDRTAVVSMILVEALERHGNEYVAAHRRLRGALRGLAGHDDPEANRRQERTPGGEEDRAPPAS